MRLRGSQGSSEIAVASLEYIDTCTFDILCYSTVIRAWSDSKSTFPISLHKFSLNHWLHQQYRILAPLALLFFCLQPGIHVIDDFDFFVFEQAAAGLGLDVIVDELVFSHGEVEEGSDWDRCFRSSRFLARVSIWLELLPHICVIIEVVLWLVIHHIVSSAEPQTKMSLYFAHSFYCLGFNFIR